MDYIAMQLWVSKKPCIMAGLLVLKGKLLFRVCVMGNQSLKHLKYLMSHVATH